MAQARAKARASRAAKRGIEGPRPDRSYLRISAHTNHRSKCIHRHQTKGLLEHKQFYDHDLLDAELACQMYHFDLARHQERIQLEPLVLVPDHD